MIATNNTDFRYFHILILYPSYLIVKVLCRPYYAVASPDDIFHFVTPRLRGETSSDFSLRFRFVIVAVQTFASPFRVFSLSRSRCFRFRLVARFRGSKPIREDFRWTITRILIRRSSLSIAL